MFKVMNFTKKTLAVTSVALGLAVTGCATAPDPSDEAAVQAFNEANDRWNR
jgi:phospholipid-binding lipoprotein MlaA